MAITKTWITIGIVGDAARPRVYEEEGSPASIQATSLQYHTNYVAGAGCISDGLQCLAMQRVEFQTLRQNSLTATFNAVRRQGLNTPLEGGYIVYYDYTSLYALSSAILYVFQNGTQVGQYQGLTDYNTHQITFGIPANDWVCCGEQYQLHVTVIDIFGASYTTPVTTITTDTLNIVTMTYDSSTTSSVTFDLDYWLDSGFAAGWLDYWDENQDPDTEQPQGHFHFYDGDTSVTANGLDEGTTYIFRVTVTLDDGQGTEIYTAYVYKATAGTDYSTLPFFIENTSQTDSTFYITAFNSPSFALTMLKSTDNTNWESLSVSPSTGAYVRLNAGERLYLRADMTRYNDGTSGYKFGCGVSHKIGGNAMSLLYKDNFTTRTLMPTYAFAYLFQNDTKLESAANLKFNRVTNTPRYNDEAFYRMFVGCTSLVYPPDTSNLMCIGEYGMDEMFEACWALEKPLDLRNITVVSNHAMDLCYAGCTRINTAYYPNTTRTNISDNWLYECAATGTIYAPSDAVRDAIVGTSVVPSGWSVVVQAP